MRIVQLSHPEKGRKVAIVKEPQLYFLNNYTTVYDLAQYSLQQQQSISESIRYHQSKDSIQYDSVYNGQSEWQILPAFDHPVDYQHCMLSGTGLTHKASADNRQKMHKAQAASSLTDSMKMYLLGLEEGKPEKGKIGAQPEWFYKGNGSILKGHGATLEVPDYGNDGGEEPEIAGVYIIDKDGQPWRIGFTIANEFSDHVMERKNYLYLAPSKIRNCSIGPELVITENFENIKGNVSIYRENHLVWEKTIHSGEFNMAHSLANLEYHHFKYSNHRLPGQTHIHFFGADAFSFGEGISLQNGDEMIVSWEGMGRPLKNRILISQKEAKLFNVKNLV
jgi:hypothetical protein